MSHCIPCAIWQNSSGDAPLVGPGEDLLADEFREVTLLFLIFLFSVEFFHSLPRLYFSPSNNIVLSELSWAQGMELQAVCLSFTTYSRGTQVYRGMFGLLCFLQSIYPRAKALRAFCSFTQETDVSRFSLLPSSFIYVTIS